MKSFFPNIRIHCQHGRQRAVSILVGFLAMWSASVHGAGYETSPIGLTQGWKLLNNSLCYQLNRPDLCQATHSDRELADWSCDALTSCNSTGACQASFHSYKTGQKTSQGEVISKTVTCEITVPDGQKVLGDYTEIGRQYQCPSGWEMYWPRGGSEEPACRRLRCDCREDLVNGQCVARQVTAYNELIDKNILEIGTNANNQGLKCPTEVVRIQQCVANGPAAPKGTACAAGVQRVLDTGYSGSGQTPSLSRPFSNHAPSL